METLMKKLWKEGLLKDYECYIIDKQLRSYHKQLAKDNSIDIAKSWFIQLTTINPKIELVRSAIDVLCKMADKIDNVPLTLLPKDMREALVELSDKLNRSVVN